MFPEAEPLQAAVALFRMKLMSFQQRMERRQAELEMLHELRRFSGKVGARCPGARRRQAADVQHRASFCRSRA